MNIDLETLQAETDEILVEATGFSSSDFADFDWASNDGRDPVDIAREILEGEGYPVESLDISVRF